MMAQYVRPTASSGGAPTAQTTPVPPAVPTPLTIERLKRQLRGLGADRMDLSFPETRAMLYVLHPDETVIGISYGRYKQENGRFVGRGVLVATNDRVFLLDKKPTYVKFDEVIYDAVSGVTYGRVWFTSTIVLHTKMGDIRMRTFNQKTSRTFIEAIESKIYGRSLWKVRS